MLNGATDQVVLFDLDGTLTDPFEGITRSIQYALETLGRPVPDTAELSWCIGPPLLESFQELLREPDEVIGDNPAREEEAREALRLYRERFAEVGMLENKVYEGIPELLEQLSRDSRRLFLATSKPRVFAQSILEHFGLAGWFQRVYGAELDGVRGEKADLLAYILEQESLSPGQAVMVGDRRHDIEGARRVGLRVLAVSYGYAPPGELVEAKPDAIVTAPQEIAAGLEALFSRSLA